MHFCARLLKWMSILREEAFGAIKTLTRLAHTANPLLVAIDIMNDY